MNRTGRATFRHYIPLCALLLLVALNQTSHGNVVPAHIQLQFPGDKAPSLPKKDLPSTVTISIASDANIAFKPLGADSTFYLTRTGGSDRELSVTLEISGTAPNRAEHATITTFITFLPGETEHIVALQPILQNLFAPGQQLFLRIIPSPKYLTASSGPVKI